LQKTNPLTDFPVSEISNSR